MRLVFGPDDHEEYQTARERLQSLVAAWARRRGIPVEPALVAAALDHRHGVDGRLGRWTRAHVADALAVWFPRTVALLDDDRDAVPVALHALIGFLTERDWLDTASAPPAELHAQIDDSTPALHDALADERNRDLGTFWAVQLRRHGVTAADPAAVARFLDQVRRGEVDVDRDALAEVTRRDTGEAGTGPPVAAPEPAPVLLPGAAALLASAESAEAVARLRTVARWVRTGRALTVDGRLLLADARSLAGALGVDAFSRDHARTADDLPETSLLVAWARQSRLIRAVKGRLVPVKSAAALLGRPIELWQRAFVAIGTLGEHFGGSNVFGAPSLFGMSLGEALPILLFDLYAAGGDPVPLELFHRRVREAVNERFGCIVDDLAGDVEQRLWRRDVTAVLDALELLGAVHLTESHDHDMLTELAGRDDPDPTLVALTPIGLWAVREMLLEQGAPAPLVGELAGEDVEYVCVRLAGARREVAEAELTAWVAARSPRAAADELARLLRRTDVPAHRALALFALRCNGERRERRDSARIRDGGRPLVPGRGPRTGPLAIRARDAAGR
ncbi:MAG: hypothetical protein JNM77_14045 [Pseudonocardia sp.]|nr:hypothetical protein [Pseudonocardia sp.]